MAFHKQIRYTASVASEQLTRDGETATARTMLLRVPEGEALPALRDLLRTLLSQGLVEAVLAPLSGPAGTVVPALVAEPERLADALPSAPAMPVSLARVLRGMAASAGARVAAVLRPCEARALVELAKLRQVDLSRLLVVAVDCLGTYPTAEHARLARERPDAMEAALARAADGEVSPEPGFAFRTACQICDRPLASQLGDGWDVAVGLVGATGDGVRLTFAPAAAQVADALAGALGLEAAPEAPAWPGREEFLADRTAHRAAALAEARAALAGPQQLASTFAACVRCGNCSTDCPICYCRECLFRSATFERPLDDYVRLAGRKGAVRLPSDTVLYHLTRMSHVAASCVGCGMCEAACPNDVPLALLFAAAARSVQGAFDYEAGRSLDEPLPLATFREDETVRFAG